MGLTSSVAALGGLFKSSIFQFFNFFEPSVTLSHCIVVALGCADGRFNL